MSKEEKKVNRRDFLFTASYTVGAVGIGAVVWPLIDQMNPDKAQQALATTEVDISNIEPGKEITVLWRGKPVFLKRRTPEEIADTNLFFINEIGLNRFIGTQRSNGLESMEKKIKLLALTL